MGDACHSTLTIDAEGKSPPQISGLYLGAIIIINCAACLTPIELFLLEVWPRHGFFSLLIFVISVIAGGVIARRLPKRYYRIRPFESSGRIYEKLGMRFFKRLTPNGDYINRVIRHSDASYRIIYDEGSIVRFEEGTRLAERCHLASLLPGLAFTAYALMLGWNMFALWLLLPNIPLHLYPLLLQRYTRARIDRVLKRRRRKSF